jgi:hypothetical protein
MRTTTVAFVTRYATALCVAALSVAATDITFAGIAQPEPNVISPEDFREGADIFRIRLRDKPHKGPLAKCPVCRKPLKDHLDPSFVCKSPDLDTVSPTERTATCPVCAHSFKAYVPDAESRGGMDMDFCRHPQGTGALASEVWMCAKCGYASPYWTFARPVSPDMKALMAEKVTPATKQRLSAMIGLKLKAFAFDDFSFLDQPSIPEFVKIENALAISDKAGAGAFAMAKLHLGAAHAFRRMINKTLLAEGLDRAIRRVDAMMVDDIAGRNDPLELAKVFRTALTRADAADATNAERISSLDRFCICMRLAGLHDRLGEGWWSTRYLDAAESLAKTQQRENVRMSLLGLVNDRRNILSREVFHLTRAAALMKQSLATGDVPRQEFATSVYLAGELQARIGEPARALPWLTAANKLVDSLQTEGGGAPAQTARLVATWSRMRLRSPVFYRDVKSATGAHIAANAEDAALVARVMPAGGAALPPPTREDDATTAAPKNVTTQDTPPLADRTAPGRTDTGTRSVAKAGTCAALMGRIWSTIEEYRRAHQGAFPPNRDALARQMGMAKGALACPETGKALFYRRPPAGSGKTFVIFHSDPAACPCKLMLFSDGTTGKFGQ